VNRNRKRSKVRREASEGVVIVRGLPPPTPQEDFFQERSPCRAAEKYPSAESPGSEVQGQARQQFTNTIMHNGKKATAEGILYGAFDVIGERFQGGCLEVFRKALDNTKPKLEVKSRRVGGATYQVPVEVRPERRVALAMRWLVTYARERGEKDESRAPGRRARRRGNGRGNAVKKKDDTHRWRTQTKHSRTTAGRRKLSRAFHAKQTQEQRTRQ